MIGVGLSRRRGSGVLRPLRRGRAAARPAAASEFRGPAAPGRHVHSIRAPLARWGVGASGTGEQMDDWSIQCRPAHKNHVF